MKFIIKLTVIKHVCFILACGLSAILPISFAQNNKGGIYKTHKDFLEKKLMDVGQFVKLGGMTYTVVFEDGSGKKKLI